MVFVSIIMTTKIKFFVVHYFNKGRKKGVFIYYFLKKNKGEVTDHIMKKEIYKKKGRKKKS